MLVLLVVLLIVVEVGVVERDCSKKFISAKASEEPLSEEGCL